MTVLDPGPSPLNCDSCIAQWNWLIMSARERGGAGEAGSKGPGDSGVVRDKAYEHIAAIRTPLINILASARPVSLFLRGWQSRDRLLLWLVVISCGQSVGSPWARSANYRPTIGNYRKLSETIGNYRHLQSQIMAFAL